MSVKNFHLIDEKHHVKAMDAAWTFSGSGAASTDREAAERRNMSAGVQTRVDTYSYQAQGITSNETYKSNQAKQGDLIRGSKFAERFADEFASKSMKSENAQTEGQQDGITQSETVQTETVVRRGRLAREDGKKCPYSSMAKDGIIEYNGVIFNCDYKHNAITLGDMPDKTKVLNISLPSGGRLKVNVDNIGMLSKAAGMFTPEDLNAIMRAIHQYNHLTRKLYEIEEEENEDAEEAANAEESPDAEQEAEMEDGSLISRINAYRTELYHKLLNNETEQKFQIGGQEMTLKEWDKLIERFDESQEDVLESMQEEAENRMEEAELEKMLQKLFEDRDKVVLG